MSSDPLNRRLEVICSRQRRSARRRAAVKRRSGGFSVFDQPVQDHGSAAGRNLSTRVRLLPRVSTPRKMQLAAVATAAGILAMTALAIEWQRPAPPPFLLADKLEEDDSAATGSDSRAASDTPSPASFSTAAAGAHETPRSAQRFAARSPVGIQADHSPYSGLDFAEEPSSPAARPVRSGALPRAAALPEPEPDRSRRTAGLRRRLLQPHPADSRTAEPFVQDVGAGSVPAAAAPDDSSEIGESSRWPRRISQPPQVEVSPVVPSPQSLQIPQLPPAAGSESEPPRPAPQQPATGNVPPEGSAAAGSAGSAGSTVRSPSADTTGVQFPSLPALPPAAHMAPGNAGSVGEPGGAGGAAPGVPLTGAVPHGGVKPGTAASSNHGADRAEQISVHSRTAAQDRLRRLALARLQAARQALKRGELQTARSIALDTQQLKVLYGLFDDRPDLVLQEIGQLEQQFATPGAVGTPPGGATPPGPSARPAATAGPPGPRPPAPAAVSGGAASPLQLRELQQLQRESLGTLIQSPVEPAAPATTSEQTGAPPRSSTVPALVSPPAVPIEPMMVPDRLPAGQENSGMSDGSGIPESADDRVNSAGWRRTDLTFQFDQVPWSTVLKQLSDVTGLELDMQAAPPGTLTYHNPRTYSPRDVIRILNLMLAERGFQLYRSGNRLVVRSLAGNAGN